MRWWVLPFLVACTGNIGGTGGGDRDAGPDDFDASVERCDDDVIEPPAPPERTAIDLGRVYRRVFLSLRGRPPNTDEVATFAAASDDAARNMVIDTAIDDALASVEFYRQAVEFGHDWIRNGAAINGTTGDGYMGNDSTHLRQCASDTAHPDAWFIASPQLAMDESVRCTDTDAPTRSVEPWWAPGTMVTLVGDAAADVDSVLDSEGEESDCGTVLNVYYSAASSNGCGCGPNAAWCYPDTGLGMANDRAGSQRRDLWDEPARLIAHLIWHDRDLSHTVVSNYTVATTRLAAWYLRFGRQTGLYNEELDGNTTWFRPEVGSAPGDPEHTDMSDADRWREILPGDLAPQLMALADEPTGDLSRTFEWNPADNAGPAPGIPYSGVLTMPGTMSYYPRERVRAARFIEIFACRSFDPPPPDQVFPAIGRDIATSGPCMHCHVLMDPVAIAFRRWIFGGDRGSNYVQRSRLAGIGSQPLPMDLFEPGLEYTHNAWFAAGAARWRGEWVGDTIMTPIAQSTIDADPNALFYDTIPPEYTIFGEHTDGTMGPLAFGKVLVQSGEFDRCATQRIYERFVGRELNPEREGRYIRELTQQFVEGGRQVRPFLRALLTAAEFRSEPQELVAPEPEPETECATSDNDFVRLRLGRNCESCHGEGASRPFFASLSAFEDLLAYDERFVVAGEPENSELVRLLEGEGTGAYTQMPTVGDTFADRADRGETQITMDEIRDWIENLPPPSGEARPVDEASATRRLRAKEYINALQLVIGQEPTSGNEPLLDVNGTPPLDPDLATGGAFYLNPQRNQVFLMMGGANYLQQTLPPAEWSATSLLAITQLAQGVCSEAIGDRNDNILRHATLSDTLADNEAAIRQNITYLYERFLHVAPSDDEVNALLDDIYRPAESTSTEAAWTQVCSALARDPLFITN